MKSYKIIKTVSKVFIGFSALSLLAVVFVTNFTLKADSTVDLTGDYPNLHSSDIPNVGSLLDRGLEFLEYFLGTLALIGFLMAGIQFGMSGGNPEKAGKAKKTMLYTAIGIIISVLSLILTRAGFYLMGDNPL